MEESRRLKPAVRARFLGGVDDSGFKLVVPGVGLRRKMITITEKAAVELAALLGSRGAGADTGLRLAVRRGGCAGLQYEMQVADFEPGDVLVTAGEARVIVAGDSLDRLRGCEIDFSDDLTDAGFKIHNPNAARSCGCGTSFEAVGEEAGLNAVADGEACGSP